ncbi:hypothetical protein, partial [Vibrio cholerae]|uniref:hypothetical protein n=1 Tax=Vibrio cholerae TaxID=666 RepID=UPI001C8E1BBC
MPYNYVSGISLALLNYPNYKDYSKIMEYLTPLLSEIQKISNADLAWRYWWGIGNSGWNETQNVSFNTPNYIGNRDGLA